MEKTIEFRNIHYQLKSGRVLLQEIDFSVSRGETMVLLGRSGSGKTTLLKLINRLYDPTAGQIFVEDQATMQWDPIELRRRIGYVIQEIGLFPHFTIEENVGLVPLLLGWKPEKIKERVLELLKLVGLDPDRFASRYPRELSGGQSQRVGVARALAADPPILLLDEPFGALDVITRTKIQEEFRDLQERLHKTIVFVTHDVKEAFYFASHMGILQDGKLIFIGEPNEVLQSEHPEVKALTIGLR